jgi:hypothetical protein
MIQWFDRPDDSIVDVALTRCAITGLAHGILGLASSLLHFAFDLLTRIALGGAGDVVHFALGLLDFPSNSVFCTHDGLLWLEVSGAEAKGGPNRIRESDAGTTGTSYTNCPPLRHFTATGTPPFLADSYMARMIATALRASGPLVGASSPRSQASRIDRTFWK